MRVTTTTTRSRMSSITRAMFSSHTTAMTSRVDARDDARDAIDGARAALLNLGRDVGSGASNEFVAYGETV